MSDQPIGTPFRDDELTLLQDLATSRARLLAERDNVQASLDVINATLLEHLLDHNTKRVQVPSGAIVQIVQQRAREVIVKEKLVELGVSMKVIDEATVSKPVAPFVRVDQPKDGAPLGTGETVVTDSALGIERIQ
jgi:hypothetical protein